MDKSIHLAVVSLLIVGLFFVVVGRFFGVEETYSLLVVILVVALLHGVNSWLSK